MARNKSSIISCLVVLALVPLSVAVGNGTCTQLNYRKAWHTLNDSEKTEYLRAEKCLLNSPAKGGVSDAAKTRWDELQWVHITQSNVIHSVGDFLPWHRMFVRLHEKLLQEECNYTGAQPYWDEQLDTESSTFIGDASVFGADDLSFGTTQDGCVVDGAFANTTLRLNQLWGQLNTTEYCLSRSYNNSYWAWANTTYSEACFAKDNYTEVWPCWSKYPHSSAHLAVGGTLGDQAASPGDPLFYLHHGNLDRLWWRWQQGNLSSRLTEMGGRSIPALESLVSFGWLFPSASVMDYDGDEYNTTTLNHVLWMGNLGPNVTVGEVMNAKGDLICADYIG